jgi:hypothetical protein
MDSHLGYEQSIGGGSDLWDTDAGDILGESFDFVPCEPGCYSDPPEPAWNDISGNDMPPIPPINHGALGLLGCSSNLPANVPVFDPICVGTCDEEHDLIPGCYDSGPFQRVTDCELVDIVTCFGTSQIRMPSRFEAIGETPNTFTETGTLVWESGVLGLTPNCVRDEGENEMTIPVSRAPQSWVLVQSLENSPCRDASGSDQGSYEVVIPQTVNVVITRSCGTPPP